MIINQTGRSDAIAELRALVERVLAMREPRCTCGHRLTAHTRRQMLCRCGCKGWVPQHHGRADQ